MAAGYNYTFVSNVPEEYICLICHYPMRKPVQTKCGHRFCNYCLDESLIRQPQCPMDRTPLTDEITDIFPDKASERTIWSFEVRCLNEENGCQRTTELGDIETHLKNCEFAKLSCPNDNCHIMLLKKDLSHHTTKECLRREERCRHCNQVSYVWCQSQRHFDVCSKYPCPCPQQCGPNEIPREEMNNHIKNVCPETTVKCKFADFGCTLMVKRKHLEGHLRDNINIESHLNLAREKLQGVRTEHSATKRELKKLQTEHGKVSTELTELRIEHDDTHERLRQLRVEHGTTMLNLNFLENMYNDTKKTIIDLQSQVNDLRSRSQGWWNRRRRR